MNNSEHAAALRINRTLDRLTKASRAAHASYRTARYANTKPVQSPREVKAHARYAVKAEALVTFCRAEGLRVPRTF